LHENRRIAAPSIGGPAQRAKSTALTGRSSRREGNGRRRRSRATPLHPEHFAVIERLLREDYSPEQIVGRLRLEGVR